MKWEQLFNVVDVGIIILKPDLSIFKWNRWMEHHSGIKGDEAIGRSLFAVYPHLNNQSFLRSIKYVRSFGNFYVFSQKLHQYLFPMEPVTSYDGSLKYMQQNCAMGLLKDEEGKEAYLYITVQDVTEIVIYDRRLLEMNSKDSLTGIYNRRFFETRIQEEFNRYKRYKQPFCLVIYDIDHFKKVNDTYGHQCGDLILKEVSIKMVNMLRATDMLARYGGEEFVCLLPETGLENAIRIAERFRHDIEETIFHFEDAQIRITVSLGVAEQKEEMECPGELLKCSDEALYKAKNSGRNCVVAFERVA